MMTPIPSTPERGRGRAVREGFTLPWNTTRTLADCWSGLGKQHDGNTQAGGTAKANQGGRPKVVREPAIKPPYAGAENKRYVLRDWAGAYLHQSCAGMTTIQAFAWRGTPSQLERIKPKFPDLIASEVA